MQERMKVPDFVDIGVIIGAGGATVRRIEEETETRIFHRRGSFTFEISGRSAENVDKGIDRILDVVNIQAARTRREPVQRDQVVLPQVPGGSRQSLQQQVHQQQPRTRTHMSQGDVMEAMHAAANMDFGALTDDEKLRASDAAKFICRSLEHS